MRSGLLPIESLSMVSITFSQREASKSGFFPFSIVFQNGIQAFDSNRQSRVDPSINSLEKTLQMNKAWWIFMKNFTP